LLNFNCVLHQLKRSSSVTYYQCRRLAAQLVTDSNGHHASDFITGTAYEPPSATSHSIEPVGTTDRHPVRWSLPNRSAVDGPAASTLDCLSVVSANCAEPY